MVQCAVFPGCRSVFRLGGLGCWLFGVGTDCEDLTGRKLRGPIGEREDYWRRGEAGGIAAESIRDLEPDGANRSIVRGEL